MAPPMSFASRLKAFDIYRKVPRDLTEASVIGGSVSLVASIFLFILFLLEMRNFFTTEYITTVEVDHSEDGIFQLNFNLTLPGLSCEFAALDVSNIIGRTKRNLHDRTIHKYSLDGQFQGSAIYDSDNEIKHLYEGTNVDHYGNTRHAIELKASTFAETVDKFEVVLVDFHAPWCSHCQHLAPIFEHAADLVKQKAPAEMDFYHKHSVALATFDCTEKENVKICRDNHIQAYPTILIFRKSQNQAIGRTFNGHEVHESYSGQRSADAISNFAMKVLKEEQNKDEKIKFDAAASKRSGPDKSESKVRTRGCRIEGFLMLQKVPGQVRIRPYSENHALNTSLFSLDHKINHLSFGRRKPSLVKKLVKDNMDGAYAEHLGSRISKSALLSTDFESSDDDSEKVNEVGFISPTGKFTHEHYIKVVSTTLLQLNKRPEHAYEYTINSNMYENEGSIPEIVFSFDLSPMKVFFKEKAKSFVQEIVNIMALIGGVFSCSIIFEGILSKMVLAAAKKLD